MAEDLNELPGGIEKALDALDRDAAKRAAAVSADRVAARVLQRLKDEPDVQVVELHPRRRILVAMRAAAALVLLVVGGVVAQRLSRGPAAQASLPVSVDVASLDSVQRTALLEAVEQARTATDSLTPATVLVEELNAQELEQLLQTMDQENSL